MSTKFAVIGSGRQGRAVAADLLAQAPDSTVYLADHSLEIARESCMFVSAVPGVTSQPIPKQVDVSDSESLDALTQQVDIVLGAVPYRLHPLVAASALRTGRHYFDLGMDTPDTLALSDQLSEIKAKNMVVSPDCGLAPGIVNILGAEAIRRHGSATSVHLYCGVLPQDRNRPLGYKLAFSLDGLIGEYEDLSYVLRNGQTTEIESLTERETFEVEGIGFVEAFVTSGGSGTSPDLYVGKLDRYEYKTIRYPGHMESMQLFRDLGFWSEEPIIVQNQQVSPKKAFAAVVEKSLTDASAVDLCIIIARAEGHGRTVSTQLVERQNPGDSFTTMERLTAFGMTIPALSLAKNQLGPGLYKPEQLVTSADLDTQLKARGINIHWVEN